MLSSTSLVSIVAFLLLDSLRQPIELSDSLLILVVLQPLTLVELPDKFFKLAYVFEESHPSASIHEGGLQYPQVAVALSEESFGAGGFAVKISMAFLFEYSTIVRQMLDFGE